MTLLATWLIGGGWSAVVLAVGWRRRPTPTRISALVADRPASSAPRNPVERLGRTAWLLAVGSDGPVLHRRRDRRVGMAVIVAVALAVISPIIAAAVIGGAVVLGRGITRTRRRLASERVAASVPDVIDLFVLVAGAGRPARSCVTLVSARATGPVAEALRAAVRRIELGERTTDALDGLVADLGEAVRPLVAALTASDRHGTALVPALERLAVEARLQCRRRAEETARRVPVKLLFPLVLCTLPAFALLTVVPLLVGSLATLRV